MKCPHCGGDVDMGVFSAGREVSRDIAAEQRAARLEDANASTAPNKITLAELQRSQARQGR